jgi:hypothetical protein
VEIGSALLKMLLTLALFTRNAKRASGYPTKEYFFLTFDVIFNIRMARAFTDKNQEKGKSTT